MAERRQDQVAATTEPTIPPEGLWAEDSGRVWLSLGYGPDQQRVKRLAFVGRGLPVTPAREFDVCCYEKMVVRLAHIRPGEPDEHGWAGSGADTWWSCNPEHPRAVLAWEVDFDGS